MPIIKAQDTLVRQNSAVPLERYIQLVGGYAECAMWGVNRTADATYRDCYQIWDKNQRDMVVQYLAEAQEEIEDVIGYFLSPRWVVGDLADEENYDPRYIDDQKYTIPLKTRWGVVIEAGVKAESTISAGESVDHSADPAVIGPVATTVTNINEIRIYYPGDDVEINPSSVVISGGNVTIQVPRCRMVKPELADNDQNGVDYTDTNNFLATVDVKRVYNDSSTNATLVSPHSCTASCSTSGCSEYTQTGCIYIREERIGSLDVFPATYTSGSWVRSGINCCTFDRVRLNYRAGLTNITKQAEDAIVRLAHAKMPHEPCECSTIHDVWERDNLIPNILTRERINCRFGLTNGAWVAWQRVQAMKLRRMSVL